ncbi:equilibrative nucleoside transporter 2 [Protopterus annectens]|uniref:equilibrative nucleoside transporter 2 n=1 Tax=Protopterus annectens TaxID=7888 RepID=UPI001CF9C337|nr:equilibrative nucleoside transporter 2 [Protopterus annectens]XP_043916416.1 equilibrative nucleoside transporter 2 [Protopterus annectens]
MVGRQAPVDRYNFVGIIFFILGLGSLLPWNFFITALDYFQYKLNQTSHVSINGTEAIAKDEFHFSNWMALLSQLPLLLFTLLNSFLYQWIPEKVRIAGSMVVMMLLFVLTAALVEVKMSPQNFFSVTMATIWFINSFGAVSQGSLFGLVGLLPQKYSTLFLSGQGMAGTFAATAKLISMANATDKETSALAYFITACFGMLIAIVCFLTLPYLEFASYFLNKNKQADCELEKKTELLQLEKNGGQDNTKLAFISVDNAEIGAGKLKTTEKPSVFRVLKKIWLMALCIVLVFTVTLAVFPAVTAAVKSAAVDKNWGDFFIPVCCFLLFNVMDWIGRSITSYITWPGENSCLLPVLVLLRFVFIPLFMLCNIEDHFYLKPLFKQDAYYVVFMVLFALSNGYLVSIIFCYTPRKVLPEEVETAGALMTFFLALGLSVGAGLSFLFRALV